MNISIDDINEIVYMVQYFCVVSILFLIPIGIYLIATFDPDGPSSIDDNGYKK
jgi:hypothetical protein